MNNSPRLRNVNRAHPPYPLNQFPNEFGLRLGREIIYLLATKTTPEVSGEVWEEIFAHCIGGEWSPSNVGLNDVILENCAWSAKSVKQNYPDRARSIRLISGRNSPGYSFPDRTDDQSPEILGREILSIWNERVSAVRRNYQNLRTVVLLKSRDLLHLGVFEFDTIRYDPELFRWQRNRKNNLEGFEIATGFHKFTWQPHGSQFTIIESVPDNILLIRLRKPNRLEKSKILESLGFDASWVTIYRRG